MRPVPPMLLAAIGFAVLSGGCSGDFMSTGPDTAAASARGKNARVTVTPPADTLTVGDSAKLVATISGPGTSGAVANWSSSDTTVATASPNGTIHGRAAGLARIVAAYGSARDTALVLVVNPPPPPPDSSTQVVASIGVSPTSVSVLAGQTAKLAAKALNSSGGTVAGAGISWASSNAAVASVDTDGTVHGLSAGSASVTASSGGKSASASVTVTVATVPVASVKVALNSQSITTGQSTQATATAYDANGNVLAGRSASWASSNGAVATVSTSGLVSAVAAGSATISATIEGITGGASISVTASSTLSGIAIYPGDSIQLKVNAAPPGTQFVIKAGTHRRQQITPKDGDTFVGEPGAVLDGENVTPYAFETLNSLPKNVTIKGLVITRYAPPYQRAAIQGDNGTYWVISDNEISYSAYECVHPGPHSQVLRNYVHDCKVGGISGYKSDSTLIADNEVAFNGVTMTAEDPATAEAAGMKFMKMYGLTFRNNFVHDNMRGIWIDTGYLNNLVEWNTVSGNLKAGIWIEATYGGVVRNNRAESNGGTTTGGWLGHAGIQVTNSPDVEIYGNTVANNQNGIGVMETSGYPDGPFGPLHVKNLYVHDNTITMATGATGVAQNVGDMSVFTSWNNRFANNTYYLGANAGYFAWNDQMSLTPAQWQAYGQDAGGAFNR